MNQVLVIGSSGLIGSRFVELFPRPESLLTPDEQEFNLLNFDSVKKYLSRYNPEIVINFAAFTAVSDAELQRGDDNGLCWQLNYAAVRDLLSALSLDRVFYLQISTDMVFPGTDSYPGPYPESTLPEGDLDYLTWYGYTKYRAETAVRPFGSIIRLGYPVRASFSAKLDFFRKPLSLFDQGKLYPLFTDQSITVTFIDSFCQVLNWIVLNRQSGIYHWASTDLTTPHQAVSELLRQARNYTASLPSASIGGLTPAYRYPRYGGLSCAKTASACGLTPLSVSKIISRMIAQSLRV